MEIIEWVVTYTDGENNVKTVRFNWRRTPTEHDAAIAIRDQLLPNGYLIQDMPRNSNESAAVHLLRSYGFEIRSITEADK